MLQVLEEIGATKYVRRFAGASAGSITAGLLAVGYTATELQGRLIDEDVPVHGKTCRPRPKHFFSYPCTSIAACLEFAQPAGLSNSFKMSKLKPCFQHRLNR